MAVDRAAARAAAREQLRNRTQESYERKDSWGGSQGFFKAGIKGVNFWWPGQGSHTVDIIPFIAGNNMPTHNGHVKEGDWAIYVDLFAHYNVGPGKMTFICPKLNYGRRCPVCEERDRLRAIENASEELKKSIESLNVSRRCIYNVVVHDSEKDYARGVQVWDASHYNIQRHIEALVEGRDGNIQIYYADLDEGKSICFKREGQGQTNTKYLGHRFLDRDYIISDEHMNAAQTLDQLIHVPTYEEIQEAFFGGQPPASDNDDPNEVGIDNSSSQPSGRRSDPDASKASTPPPSGRRQAPPADPEPEQEAASTPPPRRQASGTTASSESGQQEPPAQSAPPRRQPPQSASEESPQEPQQSTPPPRRQPASGATPPPPRRQAPAQEPDPEPQDAPAEAAESGCPYGHPFGEVDQHNPDCAACEYWEDCAAKAEELRKQNPPARRRG